MIKILTLVLSLLTLQASRAQEHTLSGTVTDEQSRPVAGASIHLLNTGQETSTDAAGAFQLRQVHRGRHILRVTAIGYASVHQEVVVEAAANNLFIALQRSYQRLDEVVVSAQKVEEPLQRLPASVTVLTAKKIEDYRLWHTRELTALTPNLYTADPGDGRNVTAVRGLVSTSYDPAVATYIDGVNQFGLDTYIPYLFDVERIEVLRGPQGTLYGRNATGGVINIITKRPGNKEEGFAEVGIGSLSQQRYSAGMRVPVLKDKLFVGAAGLHQRMKGAYTNEFNQADYDRQHTTIGNYYVHLTPAAPWSLTFNAKHSHHRNHGPFPLVVGVAEALAHPYRLNQNAVTQMVDNTFNTSLSVQHRARAFQLSAHTSWQSNYRYYTLPIDADFSPLDAIAIENNYGKDWNRVQVLTQELNLRSPASGTSAWEWFAGVYLFHQRNPVRQATRFGDDAEQLGLPDQNFSLINTSRAKGRGAALYGGLGYALTKRLQLRAGLRYDRERKELQVLGEYQKDPDPVPQFAYRPDTSAHASFSAFSPSLSLLLQAVGNSTFHLTYSRGFRAGGLTPLSSDPTQPALHPFRPEYSNNIELGSKHTCWANRLTLSTAAFYTTLTDAQVPALVLPDAVTITRNTGRLTSKGVEAELRALPTKGLAIDYSTGYTHARYHHLKIASNGSEIDLKGNRPVFTPDFTSMLAAQYNYAIGKKQALSLVVRGEWKYLGRQYFDLANTISQASYSLWNTQAGIASGNFSLLGWGRNLTNKKYISYAYEFGAVHLGAPESYGITLNIKLRPSQK